MGIKLLVVDDNETLLDLLATLLSHERDPDITVMFQAHDGKEALAYLKREHFNIDIALIDVHMSLRGEMNGFDIAKEIRRLYPGFKTIIMSIDDESSLAARSFKVGAMGFFSKHDLMKSLSEGIRRVHLGDTYLSESVRLGNRM